MNMVTDNMDGITETVYNAIKLYSQLNNRQ